MTSAARVVHVSHLSRPRLFFAHNIQHGQLRNAFCRDLGWKGKLERVTKLI